MVEEEEKKKTKLTKDLFKTNPVWARQIFAIRLINLLFPAAITRRLQKLIGDAGIFNPDLQPPGWVFDPSEFPPPVDYTWMGEYGSAPSWFTDIFGGGPVKGVGSSSVSIEDFWFYEGWVTIDPNIWTKTEEEGGSVDAVGEYLDGHGTLAAGDVWELEADAPAEIPSTVDIYIKFRAVSGTGAIVYEFYSGVVVVSITFLVKDTSEYHDSTNSAIVVYAGKGQDDLWRLEVVPPAWNLYLNGDLVHAGFGYNLSGNPASMKIIGQNIHWAQMDYILVIDTT